MPETNCAQPRYGVNRSSNFSGTGSFHIPKWKSQLYIQLNEDVLDIIYEYYISTNDYREQVDNDGNIYLYMYI